MTVSSIQEYNDEPENDNNPDNEREENLDKSYSVFILLCHAFLW